MCEGRGDSVLTDQVQYLGVVVIDAASGAVDEFWVCGFV